MAPEIDFTLTRHLKDLAEGLEKHASGIKEPGKILFLTRHYNDALGTSDRLVRLEEKIGFVSGFSGMTKNIDISMKNYIIDNSVRIRNSVNRTKKRLASDSGKKYISELSLQYLILHAYEQARQDEEVLKQTQVALPEVSYSIINNTWEKFAHFNQILDLLIVLPYDKMMSFFKNAVDDANLEKMERYIGKRVQDLWYSITYKRVGYDNKKRE